MDCLCPSLVAITPAAELVHVHFGKFKVISNPSLRQGAVGVLITSQMG